MKRFILACLWAVACLIPSCAQAQLASVGLTWEHEMGPDLVGFNVYQAEGQGDWQLVQTAGVVREVRVGDLKPGVAYRWYVTAFNEAAESGPSNEASISIPTGDAPTAVTGLMAVRDGTGLQVSWTDSETGQIVLGYHLEYLVGGSTEWVRLTTLARVALLPVAAREYVNIRVRKLTPIATSPWAEIRVPGFPKPATKLTVTAHSLQWTIPP